MIELLERRGGDADASALPTKIDVRSLDFFYGKTQRAEAVNLAVPATP